MDSHCSSEYVSTVVLLQYHNKKPPVNYLIEIKRNSRGYSTCVKYAIPLHVIVWGSFYGWHFMWKRTDTHRENGKRNTDISHAFNIQHDQFHTFQTHEAIVLGRAPVLLHVLSGNKYVELLRG